MALSDEKYMLLTTFKRDGTPVSTPVWVVPVDQASVGFITERNSGKVKRFRRSSEVRVQPCNMRGDVKPGTSPSTGTARLATDDELTRIRSAVRAKYRVVMTLVAIRTTLGKLVRKQPPDDVGVVVTVS